MKKVKEKKIKSKKDWNKILFITLLILLGLEISAIPCLIYAEVKKILPIILFLVIPTLLAISIVLLSRTCINEYSKKRERLLKNVETNN